MKKLGIGLLALSISLAMTGIGFDNAFAEEIKIENGRGSSEPGCEVTNLCFVPAIATANVGDKIIFLRGIRNDFQKMLYHYNFLGQNPNPRFG